MPQLHLFQKYETLFAKSVDKYIHTKSFNLKNFIFEIALFVGSLKYILRRSLQI